MSRYACFSAFDILCHAFRYVLVVHVEFEVLVMLSRWKTDKDGGWGSRNERGAC